MKTSPSPKSLFDKKVSINNQERQMGARTPPPVIPPQNIDRMQFLNDLDDFDKHDDNPPKENWTQTQQPLRMMH
jgi:hypothetical protein